MSRLPFNVLVLPFRIRAGQFEYAVFHRVDADRWQFIAGGGEGQEDPMATAPGATAGLPSSANPVASFHPVWPKALFFTVAQGNALGGMNTTDDGWLKAIVNLRECRYPK